MQVQINSRVLNLMLTSKRIPKFNLTALWNCYSLFFFLHLCISFVNSCKQYCRVLSFICYFVSMIQDRETIMYKENKSKLKDFCIGCCSLRRQFYLICSYVYSWHDRSFHAKTICHKENTVFEVLDCLININRNEILWRCVFNKNKMNR